jgi:Cys-rich repeat protein
MIRNALLVPAALLALLLAPPALADVAAPPPTGCPHGGNPRSDHYGGYCGAWACAADSDCWSGEVCRPASLCVQDSTYEHWRGNTTRSEVVASCTAGKACPEGAECRTGSFCGLPGKAAEPTQTPKPKPKTEAAPEAPSAPDPDEKADPIDKSARCAQVGPSAVGLLALLALAPWVRRRR